MNDSNLDAASTGRLPRSLKYWESHGGGISPFHGIRDYVRKHGLPGPEATRRLAHELKIPSATVRGVATFYSEYGEDYEYQLCDGASCQLAGSRQLSEQLKARGCKFRKVYCLGYCDHSPAILDQHGAVYLRGDALGLASGNRCHRETEGNHMPKIRCVASRPVVTRRLLRGDDGTASGMSVSAPYTRLEEALRRDPEDLLEVMEQSGECGRGGAGFLTGRKWRSCAESPADQRYVIANGDEGDPGSYVDRVLMEEDPHGIIEGMLLCGYAVGASEGIIYIRSEYPGAIVSMQRAIEEARKKKVLGDDIRGTGFKFDVQVFPGMGSYVCGEESAMINAIEGLRGEVQIRPPYPSQYGLYGKPTVVNNVETLMNVPFIVYEGAKEYASLGTRATSGTKVISLNGGFAKPGLVEVEFGTSLREVIEKIGGGSRDGKEIAAVLVGGPMGSLVLPKDWDLPICYDVLSRHGINFGHGGIIAISVDADFRGILDNWIQFMVDESCGKCTPCSLGSECAAKTLRSDQSVEAVKARLEEIFTAMEQGSLCAFGHFIPGPMRQLIEHFDDRIFKPEKDHV